MDDRSTEPEMENYIKACIAFFLSGLSFGIAIGMTLAQGKL